MSSELLYKLFSALAQGGAFALFTIGIAIAFRWIKYPDLSGDGSFTLGAVLTAKFLYLDLNIWIILFIVLLSGFIVGLFTFLQNYLLKVPKILTGVLTTMALYSINLRILGRPNLQILRSESIFYFLPRTFGFEWALTTFLVILLILVIICIILYILFESKFGIFSRVPGTNNKMSKYFGISIFTTGIGLGLSNAVIALSGSIIAQRSYSADIHMGFGQVIVAIAALFIGSIIFKKTIALQIIFASIVGSLLYMLLMQLALEIGVQAQDFKLISTIIVLVSVLIATRLSKQYSLRRASDLFGID